MLRRNGKPRSVQSGALHAKAYQRLDLASHVEYQKFDVTMPPQNARNAVLVASQNKSAMPKQLCPLGGIDRFLVLLSSRSNDTASWCST